MTDPNPPTRRFSAVARWLAGALALAIIGSAAAQEHGAAGHGAAAPKAATPVAKAAVEAKAVEPKAAEPKAPEQTAGQRMAQQLREAIEASNGGKPLKGGKVTAAPNVTMSIEQREGKNTASLSQEPHQVQRARAIAHGLPMPRAVSPKAASAAAAAGHDAQEKPHWSYEGPGGPQDWASLSPDNMLCASGKRQSPIHIEEAAALQGPAEALRFDYRPSNASVVNNGHTIQVDVEGDNTLLVRGSTYKLLQFHFHHPAEEKINYKGFAMVAHLVHRNAEGQLAVVAVLLDPGAANAFIDKVWTYMPLDVNDRVRGPADWLDLRALLPQDQRYYQFMGSLTTPPCSEGVLWMVLKQPVSLSREQLKLFTQLFPNNARPVQALNGRVVRDGQ